METPKNYIPALRFKWLTPIYDPVLKWGMREDTFKRKLIEQAQIKPGNRVLDLGCGTGTLTIMLKQSAPQANIAGLDGDPEVLAIAQSKANQVGAEIKWETGLSYDLPYLDNSFNVVVSCLVMHHLSTADKLRTFQEVLRVLRPGGRFHIADFGEPHSTGMWLASLAMRHVEETKDNFDGKLPAMLLKAGFGQVEEVLHLTSVFGPLTLYRAVKSQTRPG